MIKIMVLSSLIVIMIALSGCSSTESTRFYLLTPEADPVPLSVSPEQTGLVITLGAVRLPEYLNRYQIVTRVSENELELGWFDRWAEPLDRNVARVLTRNVEQLLGCRCNSVPSPNQPLPIIYRIEAEVTRMDGILGGEADFDVRWSIYTPEKKVMLTRRSSFTRSAKGQGYDAFVQAQSKILFDFSKEIASAILEQENKTQGQ